LEPAFDVITEHLKGTEVLKERVQNATPSIDKDNNKDMILAVVRVTFGQAAADEEDGIIRLSPGAVRIVANRADKDGNAAPYDYYPIGTLEPGSPNPLLYVNKPDDFIFIGADRSGATRSGVDLVFAIDKAGFVEEGADKKLKIADGVFLELKRMFREDLGGKPVDTWTGNTKAKNRVKGPPPAGPRVVPPHNMTIESMHQVEITPDTSAMEKVQLPAPGK
jgi:hypothetical protein